jgi:hypothetical protein
MDERELDAKLSGARGEAEQFFSRRSGRSLEEMVYRRIRTDIYRGLRPTVLYRAGAATVALLLLAIVLLKAPGTTPAGVGTPVAQQPVPLEKQGPAHWVNFFRVTQPDSIRESLLAVLWAPQPEGGWQPVYSSLLAGDGDPLPVALLELPGSRGQLVVISSRDQQGEYLSYRLVGYDSGRILSYHEKDYVPRGEIEVAQGFLVERRAAPRPFSPGKDPGDDANRDGRAVTNLIPYYIDDRGEIIVPQDPLPLEVGQYLVLVGNDAGGRVKAFARGVITPARDGFYTYALGDACLILIADDDPRRTAQLSIKVLEPGLK